MAIWVHRPMPDLDGEEHCDNDGACWCNPIRLDGPAEALKLAKVLAQVAVDMVLEGEE